MSPKRNSLFILLFVFFVAIANSAMADKTTFTEEKALDTLVELIKKDKLYSSWIKLECMSFMTEEESPDNYDIGIHEKHGGKCAGDPNTYPIVDRFRINRKSGNVFWYDVGNGEYVPYEEFKKSKRSK